jgi:uncharacterized protein
VATVSQLWRYPVKSMQGERIAATRIDGRGVVGDRGRAVIDLRSGKAASGSWAARRWSDLVTWSAAYLTEPVEGGPLPDVRISHPSHGSFTASGAPGDDQDLSQRLQRDVRLAVGQQDDAMSGHHPAGSFWDVASIHVVTTSTLHRLAEAAPGKDFDVRRFRPNLVIDTGEDVGFAEAAWVGSTLSIGATAQLRITRHCPRCVMTTHAQGDLPRDPGILQTAARVSEANVGVYAEVVRPGLVGVGDVVEVADDGPDA